MKTGGKNFPNRMSNRFKGFESRNLLVCLSDRKKVHRSFGLVNNAKSVRVEVPEACWSLIGTCW